MAADSAVITVVIPVWDEYVRELPQAVASVRAQAAPISLIVVDNASTASLPELDGVAVVSCATRLSAGAARNLGLERVETAYVVFLDADDLLPNGSLAFLAAELDAHPEASVCVTSILEAETGGRHRSPRPFVAGLTRLRRTFALAHSVWSLYPTQGCAMMRAGLAREAGGYGDVNGGEDWVLGVSLAFRGRVLVRERIGLIYRAQAGEASLWRSNRSAADLRRAAALVRERIRADPAVSGFARTAVPAIAMLQLLAIEVLRPLYRAVRAFSRRAFRRASTAPGKSANVESGRHT
jgi:glycosyltransferase involved in cell wall biosynthesis